MSRTVWTALLVLALTLGAFGGGARGALQTMQNDCCETMCPDMSACANMQLCKTCSAPSTLLPVPRALVYLQETSFPHPSSEQPHIGPIAEIWIPPD